MLSHHRCLRSTAPPRCDGGPGPVATDGADRCGRARGEVLVGEVLAVEGAAKDLGSTWRLFGSPDPV